MRVKKFLMIEEKRTYKKEMSDRGVDYKANLYIGEFTPQSGYELMKKA